MMSTQNIKSVAHGISSIKVDEELTKKFVEETANNALNQAKQYVDDKFEQRVGKTQDDRGERSINTS